PGRKGGQVARDVSDLPLGEELTPGRHRRAGDALPDASLDVGDGGQLAAERRAELVLALTKVARLDVEVLGEEPGAVSSRSVTVHALREVDLLAPPHPVGFGQIRRHLDALGLLRRAAP